MVNFKTKKFGFTLAETLISMLIISVFFIAASKVMTKKQNVNEARFIPHGYYECYVQDGQLMEFGTNYDPEVEHVVNVCHYNPPRNVSTYTAFYRNIDNSGNQRTMALYDSQFDDEIDISANRLSNLMNEFDATVLQDIDPADLLNLLDASAPDSRVLFLLNRAVVLQQQGGGNGVYPGPAFIIQW